MKILLVEDEAKTVAFLKKGLSENGFILDVARDGETGLHLAMELDYDLVILDVMLPRSGTAGVFFRHCASATGTRRSFS